MTRLGHLSGKQDQKIMEIGKAFKIFFCWTQLLVHVLEKFVQSIIAWVKRYYGGVTKLIIEKYSKFLEKYMKTTACETILITLFSHAPSSKGSQMKGKKCVHLNYGLFFKHVFKKILIKSSTLLSVAIYWRGSRGMF